MTLYIESIMASQLYARKKQQTPAAVGGGNGGADEELDNSERSLLQQQHQQQQQSHHLYLPLSPDSGSELHKKQQRYRRSVVLMPSAVVTRSLLPAHWGELRAAVGIVCGFLFVGLFVSFFLLHHQHRNVILHVLNDPVGHGKALRGRAGFRHHFYSGPPRYVTVVLPSVVNPDGRSRRLDSIQDTWGPYARAIFVVHNVTEFPQAAHAVLSETSSPEDPYAYPQLALLPPHISIVDGLPRLYYTIRTIYEKVNPDFAFFVNDHTFVLPEHLCQYLEDQSATTDLYAGHALKNGDHEVFNSGAAGYLLSRETMKKLVAKWDEKDSTCWLDDSSSNNKWLQNNPGLVTNRCLDSLGIKAIDTRAAHKWHRFHAFPLTRVVTGQVDEWYIKKHQGLAELAGFEESYETLLSGVDCCSMDTVSFHYVEWKESKALFAIRGELLANPHLSDHELKSMLLKEWPSKDRPKEVGAYSRPLPSEDDVEGWQALLSVLRKISTRKTQRDC